MERTTGSRRDCRCGVRVSGGRVRPGLRGPAARKDGRRHQVQQNRADAEAQGWPPRSPSSSLARRPRAHQEQPRRRRPGRDAGHAARRPRPPARSRSATRARCAPASTSGLSKLVETRASGGGRLSYRLVLTVKRLSTRRRPQLVYTGPLRQMPLVKLGVFRPEGDAHLPLLRAVPRGRDEHGRPLPGASTSLAVHLVRAPRARRTACRRRSRRRSRAVGAQRAFSHFCR